MKTIKIKLNKSEIPKVRVISGLARSTQVQDSKKKYNRKRYKKPSDENR